jgi:hypothetical protein
MGQKATLGSRRATSASSLKVDVAQHVSDVYFVPLAELARPLFLQFITHGNGSVAYPGFKALVIVI